MPSYSLRPCLLLVPMELLCSSATELLLLEGAVGMQGKIRTFSAQETCTDGRDGCRHGKPRLESTGILGLGKSSPCSPNSSLIAELQLPHIC